MFLIIIIIIFYFIMLLACASHMLQTTWSRFLSWRKVPVFVSTIKFPSTSRYRLLQLLSCDHPAGAQVQERTDIILLGHKCRSVQISFCWGTSAGACRYHSAGAQVQELTDNHTFICIYVSTVRNLIDREDDRFLGFLFLPTAYYYSLCVRAQNACRYTKTAKRNSMNGSRLPPYFFLSHFSPFPNEESQPDPTDVVVC
jgi:hypothetical protein